MLLSLSLSTGSLQPTKGKYSKRGNDKRAYWMKGRIFRYAKYKAYTAGILTSRVNPRNTSRECARCHSLVARYAEGQPVAGYTYGAPLAYCACCDMRGNADRNASLVIGQRLVTRYQKQEKPPTPLLAKREPKGSGEVHPQDARKQKQTIYPICKAWGELRAWHRPGCVVWDGETHVRYSSPTTAST